MNYLHQVNANRLPVAGDKVPVPIGFVCKSAGKDGVVGR
jgi:hypothetical protein